MEVHSHAPAHLNCPKQCSVHTDIYRSTLDSHMCICHSEWSIGGFLMVGESRRTFAQSGPDDVSICTGTDGPDRWKAVELSCLCAVLGRKWTPAILTTLAEGPMRHGHLSRRLAGIARKVLHNSLDGLMADGLVEKIIGADHLGGASVRYGLTPLGMSLTAVLDCLQLWCNLNLDELHAARVAEFIPIRTSDELGPVVTSR